MFQTKHVYLTLIDRLETLKNEINAIRLRDFPDEAPQSVIDVLSTILNCIEVQAKTDLDEDPTSNTALQNAYLALANRYLDKLELIHDAIGAVSNGVKTRVPWALTRVVNEVIRSCEQQDTLVIYSPIWQLNFAIHPNRLSTLYKDLGSVLDATIEGQKLKKSPPRIIAIYFSYLDRMSPLLYGVLGHEIGHIFSNEYLSSSGLIDDAWSAKNADPYLSKISDPNQRIRSMLLINQVRKRAVEEIGADLFAVRTVGPAFIFSLFDVLSRFSLDVLPSSRSSYYPSNRTRIKLSMDLLKADWDYSASSTSDTKNVFREALGKLQHLVNEKPSVEHSTTESEIAIAYKYVSEVDVPSMITKLKTWVKKPFGYESFFQNAKELSSRLESNIPPNQHGVELNSWVDSITILNVTWLNELRIVGSTAWKDLSSSKHLKRCYLHDRLALKAIELAEIQRSFKDAEPVRE